MLKIIVTGNIGNDAEVRDIGNGNCAISFSLAHTEKWKDAGGNPQERTTWVKCTKWAKTGATTVAQYLKKGTKLLIEGVPSSNCWINKTNGEAASILEIKVDNLEFMGSPQQPQAPNVPTAPPYNPDNVLAPGQTAPAPPTTSFLKKEDEDDLPF